MSSDSVNKPGAQTIPGAEKTEKIVILVDDSDSDDIKHAVRQHGSPTGKGKDIALPSSSSSSSSSDSDDSEDTEAEVKPGADNGNSQFDQSKETFEDYIKRRIGGTNQYNNVMVFALTHLIRNQEKLESHLENMAKELEKLREEQSVESRQMLRMQGECHVLKRTFNEMHPPSDPTGPSAQRRSRNGERKERSLKERRKEPTP